MPLDTTLTTLLCVLYFFSLNPTRKKVVLWMEDESVCRMLKAAGFHLTVIKDEAMLRSTLTLEEEHVLCVICDVRNCNNLESMPAELLSHWIHLVLHYQKSHIGVSKFTHHVEQIMKKKPASPYVGILDASVNFGVPVGGSCVFGAQPSVVDAIAQFFPGRASGSTSVDVLSSLVWTGVDGWKRSLKLNKEGTATQNVQPTLTRSTHSSSVDDLTDLPDQRLDSVELRLCLARYAAHYKHITPVVVACPVVSARYLYSIHAGLVCDWVTIHDTRSTMYDTVVRWIIDCIRMAGIQACDSALLLPHATGIGLLHCLIHLKRLSPNARYVIWSRIDQKTCFKCILTAGLIPVVIELQRRDDQLHSDLTAIEQAINHLTPEQVCCVMSTNCCFAPRVPDDVVGISGLCATYQVPHVVNNAYGIQSTVACLNLNTAIETGRVDFFVSSTDKNFLVPVGGAVICAGSGQTDMEVLRKSLSGVAMSSSACLDVFSTLLHLGKSGWVSLLADKIRVYGYFAQKLKIVCDKLGFRLLDTPNNDISFAVDLSSLYDSGSDVRQIGSMLFHRRCSGARVNVTSETKSFESAGEAYEFTGWGTHSSDSNGPTSYLNVAAALGMTEAEVDTFCTKLESVVADYRRQKPS